MKIFLDTNVLVSAYMTRGLCADLMRQILTEHEFLTGEVNLVELERVLRVRFKVPAEKLKAIESELRDQTIVPKPAKPSSILVRDPDDRWVLASAAAGDAEMLVTGDKDLLAVAAESPIPIVDPRGCWDRLHG